MQKSKTFTNCILVDSSTDICWTSPFIILEVSGLFCRFILILMENLLANTVDSDQMSHYVASDLGLHCLPITRKKLMQEKPPNLSNIYA